MSAPPPRLLSPFVRTRTRLTLTLGLLLAALTATLLPWWQPSAPPAAQGAKAATGARQASTGPRDEAAASAEARRTGKKVLVDTATTQTELTWALPNGRMRTQVHALPQRAKNADGVWAPIDTTLRRVANAGALGVRPVNAALPVRFSGGTAAARTDRSYTRLPLADRPRGGETVLAEVDLGGHTIAYTWPNALPEPVLDGPRALYPEVLPGVDLLLVARQEGGFGQLLVVKNREAARNKELATVTYGLRSKTAVFRQDAKAARVRILDRAGKEVGTIPTPFAWDSSGRDPELPAGAPRRTSVATPADVLRLSGLSGAEPGARSAQLPVVLGGDGTGTARLGLRVAETGLLTDAGTRFPVFVDPPLNSASLGWTVAYRRYPNSSFWNGTNFSSGTSDARVGYESETGGLARSFWRMEFSSAFKDAVFTEATFKVLNNHSWSCTERQFEFWLTGSISTSTTWSSQPAWKKLLQKKSFAHGWNPPSGSSNCPNEYEAFDVEAAAQEGANNGWSSITFGMQATSEDDTQTWRKFQASSAVLEGEYNRVPSEPTDGESDPGDKCVPGPDASVTVGLQDITLKATAKDRDGNLSKLRFRFWKDGTAAPVGVTATPDTNGTARVVIDAADINKQDSAVTPLVDKGLYSWDVRAEDSAGGLSTFFPPGTAPCRITVDGSAPPTPTVSSADFPAATADGKTWSKQPFGKPGTVYFFSRGARKIKYRFEGVGEYRELYVPGTGMVVVDDFAPPHAGPNTLHVYAYDEVGNASARRDHSFYVKPRDLGDGPGDVGGDGTPDLLLVNSGGNLRTYSGSPGGELHSGMTASYVTKGSALDPAGHWYDPATGKTALITHYNDAYPGDGTTDLFAVTPDGTLWLYPGDGYGSFNVDHRIEVELPAGVPAPSTWTQMKAVGDITGDKLPDLVLRTGTSFWVLSGYTGATFRSATLMNDDAWARRDIVNLADMNKDGTPDLLWRNLDNGNVYARHGKPGSTAGSVDLNSLMVAANALNGDFPFGTGWTEAAVSTAIGIPDINKDGVPDVWSRTAADGTVKIHYPSASTVSGTSKTVITTNWNAVKAFG